MFIGEKAIFLFPQRRAELPGPGNGRSSPGLRQVGSQITSHEAENTDHIKQKPRFTCKAAVFEVARSLSYDWLAFTFGRGDERANRQLTQIVHVILVIEPISTYAMIRNALANDRKILET